MDDGPGSLAAWGALGLFLALAVGSDLRSRRVPNGLVAAGLAVALAVPLAGALVAADGLSWRLAAASVAPWAAGLVLGGLLLLPGYALGGMAAGDVKLMAMAGAFLGPGLAAAAVLYTCLAGGALALAALAWRRARGRPAPTHQAYAPAIALGCAVAVWAHAAPQG